MTEQKVYSLFLTQGSNLDYLAAECLSFLINSVLAHKILGLF